jgi:hypothetical protein
MRPYPGAICNAEHRELPDVVERVIDRTLLWLAFMLIEISLQLLFGFVRIGYKFSPGPERQFANIAIRGVRSAADESDDPELAVRHQHIIAGHS